MSVYYFPGQLTDFWKARTTKAKKSIHNVCPISVMYREMSEFYVKLWKNNLTYTLCVHMHRNMVFDKNIK